MTILRAEIEIDTQDRVHRALRATPTRLVHASAVPFPCRDQNPDICDTRAGSPFGIVPSASSAWMIAGAMRRHGRQIGLVDRHAEFLLGALTLLGEPALGFLAEQLARLFGGLAQDVALRVGERLPFPRVHHDVEDLEVLVGAGPVLGDLDVLLVDRDADGLRPALDDALLERQIHFRARHDDAFARRSPARSRSR